MPPGQLSIAERQRYSRHLLLPEVGEEGQRRLKAARVLCVGAGGLGSPAALYLAAAGVGTLGLVDFDVVDFSNLQRQIIHGTPDVGRSKVESAQSSIEATEPRGPRRNLRRALLGRERQGAGRSVRRDRRRHRQLSRALSRERRVRDLRPAERVGQHLPVRRPGGGVRGAGRPVLPLPPSRAAAGGARAELRRSRRPRRAAGHHRHHPGDRSAEADSRHRRSARRPVPRLRRAEDALPRAQAAEGSRLPGLRGPSDDHHAARVRRVVRRAIVERRRPNARCAS